MAQQQKQNTHKIIQLFLGLISSIHL